MLIVGASSSVSVVPRQATREAPDQTAAEAPGHGLVAIDPPQRHKRLPHSTRHPSAPFVAHLLAMRMQAPQTRERRRAEPEEATVVYRSMTKPAVCRHMFSARV